MSKKTKALVDIFVIGGGINGAGIARDAAGRGLSVILAEKDDLAAHTSSSSSKLIHGGLRYLEHYEFRLVRESLKERETLLKAAPHLIHPLRFILPHHKAMRPAFILRLGLFLYDYIGGRKILPATITRNLRKHPFGEPLQTHFTKGFEYSDCWVDDARLVCLAVKDAHEHGARILVGHEVIRASRSDGIWTITVSDKQRVPQTYHAKTLVNAAGPWVDEIEDKTHPAPASKKQIRMVKGSHIIVPKLYEGEQAYTFQHSDNRVIFAIPYEEAYTLIGTTDVPYKGDPNHVKIEKSEETYLCEVAAQYFSTPVKAADIVWRYSGVRPLVDDGQTSASKTTRDYVLELDTKEHAALLSIYGGKITTFRCLAEEALEELKPYLGFTSPDWTQHAPLPGGDMEYAGLSAYKTKLIADYPWLPIEILERYIRSYGTYSRKILKDTSSLKDLGHHFGAGLYERELTYMYTDEWATNAEAALWRRSKLGLHMTKTERLDVDTWFKNQSP